MNSVLRFTNCVTAVLALIALGCTKPEAPQLTTPAATAKAVEVKLTKPVRQKLVRIISRSRYTCQGNRICTASFCGYRRQGKGAGTRCKWK